MVVLNALVIMAVKKKRQRLQNNTNILLACLTATDTLTGFSRSTAIFYRMENGFLMVSKVKQD